MKKIISIIMAAAFCLFGLTGCKNETKTIVFYVPDGAPALAVTQIFGTTEVIENVSVKSELVTGAAISSLIAAGTPDIALAPINICATGFNRSGYVLGGIALWGINYIMSKDENVKSLNDLVGEKVYAFQESGTPGLTLKATITMAGLNYKVLTGNDTLDNDKINLFFVVTADAPNDIVQIMKNQNAEITDAKHAVLAEPVAQKLVADTAASSDKVYNAIDLQEAYAENNGGNSYPQVGVIVKKALIEENKAFVDAFLKKIGESCLYAITNPALAAADAIDKVASSALPGNKTLISQFLENKGQQAFIYAGVSEENIKNAVSLYLSKLTEITGNLQIVGGALPSDDFYYGA